MANRFHDTIDNMRSDEPLDLDLARRTVGDLIEDIGKRILGQEHMVRRVVSAAVLGKHVLIEGMPGEAKTTCVSEFARRVGLRFRRVQFVPDMLPGDLIGSRQLELDKKTGQPDLVFREGPLCATIIVADEINRAPSKVQAAMLEVMAEKQISRIDKEEAHTPYHPDDRSQLLSILKQHSECFGVPIPHPDDHDRVLQVIFATQNPVEQEGTYPLSEASTDRFTFKVVVQPPSVLHYTSIAKVNVFQSLRRRLSHPGKPREPIAAAGALATPARAQLPVADATDVATQAVAGPGTAVVAAVETEGNGHEPVSKEWVDPLPIWLKSICFFQGIRDKLFDPHDSMAQFLLEKKPGLWDRVRLVIMLSHYLNADGDLSISGDETELPGALRTHHQDSLRRVLAEWNRVGDQHSEKVRQQIDAMLTKSMFEYVERGSSPRGLIDWMQAAVADAFVMGEAVVCRRHFRVSAVDVLRHRITLSAQAAANRIGTPDFVMMLVQTLLPESETEEAEDAYPLINVSI